MTINGNAALYFVDRHLAEGRSGKTAFIQGDQAMTYGQLAEKSGRMGDLYAKLGLGQEDRAAMIVHDVLEFPVIFWGSLKAGVVPVAINTLLTAEQYRYILTDSRAKALFVSAQLLETIRPILHELPHLRVVFVVGGEDPVGAPFEAALEQCIAGPVKDVSAEDTAFWLYSSGSTGMPKGVRHVHQALQATSDTYGAKVLSIKESDKIFSAAKLFFAYGLGNGMTFPMAVGATTVLLPGRPTPEAVFQIMMSQRPTIYCGVPTLYAAMLAEAGQGMIPGAENLRVSISAGEALPAEIGTRWKTLTGTDILDGVGSTEMLHIFLSNAPGDVEYGTSGIAVPGYDLRLVDTDGSLVADDEVGELLVSGVSSADGYWNQREKSRQTFEGVWTRTGDKYTRRPDGRYIYSGRTDDMFKVSGQWVSPFEVEQALSSHESVLEAAVVPALDEEGLEKPKAFVVPAGDATINPEALQEHVKTSVGAHKYPRWIEVRDELPKTATGKIQRFKLREG
ncbi:MAG: benzoate-CoA ligase family protein [Pseudomonadota bacterium]